MFSIECMLLDVEGRVLVVGDLREAVLTVKELFEDFRMVRKMEEFKRATNVEDRIISQETVMQKVLNVMPAENSKDIL